MGRANKDCHQYWLCLGGPAPPRSASSKAGFAFAATHDVGNLGYDDGIGDGEVAVVDDDDDCAAATVAAKTESMASMAPVAKTKDLVFFSLVIGVNSC